MESKMVINWGSLLSAFAGGSLTLLGTLFFYWLDQRKQKNREKELVHGLLQALHDEHETLWNTYNERVGVNIEALPPDQPFICYWGVFQEYFTVYNSNAFLIGKIANNDLRKSIIETTIKARGLIDSFRLNNDFVYKYEQAFLLAFQTNEDKHNQLVEIHRKTLIKYAEKLKQGHQDQKERVQNLLREFRKQGVLSTKPKA